MKYTIVREWRTKQEIEVEADDEAEAQLIADGSPDDWSEPIEVGQTEYEIYPSSKDGTGLIPLVEDEDEDDPISQAKEHIIRRNENKK